MCDCRRLRLDIGFIDRLYTRLGTTSNYSPTANFHNSQITTAPTKTFLACCVFTSHCLATTSNSGESTASGAHVISSPTHIQNCLPATSSGTRLTLFITFRHEPYRKHRFNCYSPTVPRLLLGYSLPRERVYPAVA
jgi:hypothetical protein